MAKRRSTSNQLDHSQPPFLKLAQALQGLNQAVYMANQVSVNDALRQREADQQNRLRNSANGKIAQALQSLENMARTSGENITKSSSNELELAARSAAILQAKAEAYGMLAQNIGQANMQNRQELQTLQGQTSIAQAKAEAYAQLAQSMQSADLDAQKGISETRAQAYGELAKNSRPDNIEAQGTLAEMRAEAYGSLAQNARPDDIAPHENINNTRVEAYANLAQNIRPEQIEPAQNIMDLRRQVYAELASNVQPDQTAPQENIANKRIEAYANLAQNVNREDLQSAPDIAQAKIEAYSNLAKSTEPDQTAPQENLANVRAEAYGSLAQNARPDDIAPQENINNARIDAYANLAQNARPEDLPNTPDLAQARIEAYGNLAKNIGQDQIAPHENIAQIRAKAYASLAQNAASSQEEIAQIAQNSHAMQKAQALQALASIAQNASEQGARTSQAELENQARANLEAQKLQVQQSIAQAQAQVAQGIAQGEGEALKMQAAQNLENQDEQRAEILARIASQNTVTQTRIAKNTLNGGEIAPHLDARFDQPRFQNSSHKLLNMVVLPTGGVTKRPGFAHVADSVAHSGARLHPFIFSASETCLLEFYTETIGGPCKMRILNAEGEVCDSGLTLPFATGQLDRVSFAQSGDVLFYACSGVPPGKIMRIGGFNHWKHEVMSFAPPIQAPQIIDVYCRGTYPSGENRTISIEYQVTAIDSVTGMESEPSPSYIKWGIPPMSQTYYPVVNIIQVEGAAEYRVYRKYAGIYGFIGIIPGGWYEFEDKNYSPDVADTPPEYKKPFSENDPILDTPSLVTIHQQRLCYAASTSHPLTLWFSPTGNYDYLAASIPPDEDDAIEVSMGTTQANKILWLSPDRQSLALGTEGGEWILQATEGAGLTPNDLAFQSQTSHGAEPNIAPIRCNNQMLFIQRGGRIVREFGYSFADDKYVAGDLSLLARHIFEDHKIKKWAYQPEPYGIVWCLLDNSELAALTYLKEHEVIAWSRHTTNAQIFDICTVPDEKGRWRLYIRTFRDGKYNIEVLNNFGESCEDYDGVLYPCRLVPTLPEAGQESFTSVKKINSFKCRMFNSAAFEAKAHGGKAGEGQAMRVPSDPTIDHTGGDLIFDFACHIAGGWRSSAGIELIFDRAGPATLLGIEFNMEIATSVGNQQ